jgi:hypothetical protein
MASYNKHRRIIPIEQEEEYKNKVINEGKTLIQLSENHYLAIKDFQSKGINKLINNTKHKTALITTRERLLEKLIDKKVKDKLHILNEELKELRD